MIIQINKNKISVFSQNGQKIVKNSPNLVKMSRKSSIFTKIKNRRRAGFYIKKLLVNYLTLSTYSPVLVFTLISSPSFTNKGTLTVAPVSTVAGFNVRVAVSPFMPGSL